MATKTQAEEMLTVAKWAEKFAVPAGKFKKAIEELKLEPDLRKGACNYYSSKTIEKVKAKLN